VFVTTLVVGSRPPQLALNVEFAAASLPALLIVLFISLRLIGSRRGLRSRIETPSDLPNLRIRLFRLGENVKSRMQIQGRVKFVVGLNSSFVYSRNQRGANFVNMGDQFLRGASDPESQGILAHELAHMNHMRKKRAMTVITTELFAIQVIFLAVPAVFIVLGLILASWLFLTVRINWGLEYQADKEASRKLDPMLVVMGLKKLASQSFEGFSTSHPSLSSRVARLGSRLSSPERTCHSKIRVLFFGCRFDPSDFSRRDAFPSADVLSIPCSAWRVAWVMHQLKRPLS